MTPLGSVKVNPSQCVTAELTMFADDDGCPVLGGNTVYPDGDGGFKTGTFRFLVAELRVAG